MQLRGSGRPGAASLLLAAGWLAEGRRKLGKGRRGGGGLRACEVEFKANGGGRLTSSFGLPAGARVGRTGADAQGFRTSFRPHLPPLLLESCHSPSMATIPQLWIPVLVVAHLFAAFWLLKTLSISRPGASIWGYFRCGNRLRGAAPRTQPAQKELQACSETDVAISISAPEGEEAELVVAPEVVRKASILVAKLTVEWRDLGCRCAHLQLLMPMTPPALPAHQPLRPPYSPGLLPQILWRRQVQGCDWQGSAPGRIWKGVPWRDASAGWAQRRWKGAVEQAAGRERSLS